MQDIYHKDPQQPTAISFGGFAGRVGRGLWIGGSGTWSLAAGQSLALRICQNYVWSARLRILLLYLLGLRRCTLNVAHEGELTSMPLLHLEPLDVDDLITCLILGLFVSKSPPTSILLSVWWWLSYKSPLGYKLLTLSTKVAKSMIASCYGTRIWFGW